MALASAALVREVGGIDDGDAYNLFRLANDAALNTLVTARLAVASSWLKTRAPDEYASSDTDIQALFTHAEALLAMHFLCVSLKARKVYGTHFPYDSEGSDRYAELIDVEWMKQVEELVGPFLVVQAGDEKAFAAPVFLAGGVIDRSTLDGAGETTELQDIIDEANDLPGIALSGG